MKEQDEANGVCETEADGLGFFDIVFLSSSKSGT